MSYQLAACYDVWRFYLLCYGGIGVFFNLCYIDNVFLTLFLVAVALIMFSVMYLKFGYGANPIGLFINGNTGCWLLHKDKSERVHVAKLGLLSRWVVTIEVANAVGDQYWLVLLSSRVCKEQMRAIHFYLACYYW